MPILQNAKKALRSSKRKTTINQLLNAKTRTAIKKAKTQPTVATLSLAFSAVDKSVKKKLMHRNKAARLKSQLSSIKPVEKATKEKLEVKKEKAVRSKKTAVAKKTSSSKKHVKVTKKASSVKKSSVSSKKK